VFRRQRRKLAALALRVHADGRPALERALLDLELIRPGEARQPDTARGLVRDGTSSSAR
jgi:hypothetical protein